MDEKDNDKDRTFSRREFLKTTAGAAVITAVGTPGCKKKSRTPTKLPPPSPRKTGKSTVVLIRDENVLDDHGRPRAKIISRMLDTAVSKITGQADALAGWKTLLKAEDRLGIKTNVWSYLHTPKSLENHIRRQARAVGIPADRIAIDDRGCRSTLADATALINARPMRSHHWAGVGGCIKNYIMFDEVPSRYHPDSCADLGALFNLPSVKGKTRLNILVMLTPLFHGRGPHHYNPKYVWRYNGLIVSTDPVAADAVGREILRGKRRQVFGRNRPFATRTKHIDVADTRHGIGIADLERIQIIRLGWEKDVLIRTG